MAFSRSVIGLLVFNVVFSYAAVPVFIWGDLDGKPLKANPLSKLTEQEFQNILTQELPEDTFIAVFVDKSLSVEDFSLKNDDGETVFPYLHANIGDAVYLPSVDNALDAVQAVAKSEGNVIEVTDKGLSAEIEKKNDDVLYVSLEDAQIGESRADLLRRHNDLMEDMFSKLQQKYDKVVAIYTARFPSWIVPVHSIVRRQALQQEENATDYTLDGLRLYVRELMLYINDEPTQLSGLSTSITEFNATDRSMATSMKFQDVELILNFYNRGGYWYFDRVILKKAEVNEELQAVSELHAPIGFSYRCAQKVNFTSGVYRATKATVLFEDFKVQPFFTNGTPEFGDSINCVGFFSVPIWSGLFVTFILLAITFYGIMLMLDIRTMDRFDDPKGKTITINAGE